MRPGRQPGLCRRSIFRQATTERCPIAAPVREPERRPPKTGRTTRPCRRGSTSSGRFSRVSAYGPIIAACRRLKAQGELETRIAIEDFVASLAAEYYNFVQQKIRLKNFRYAVSLSKERLRIVEARYRIGSFSRLDLLQARVDFNADRLAVHHAAGARFRFAYPAQRV